MFYIKDSIVSFIFFTKRFYAIIKCVLFIDMIALIITLHKTFGIINILVYVILDSVFIYHCLNLDLLLLEYFLESKMDFALCLYARHV